MVLVFVWLEQTTTTTTTKRKKERKKEKKGFLAATRDYLKMMMMMMMGMMVGTRKGRCSVFFVTECVHLHTPGSGISRPIPNS
jgi:hypothetical protein